jgi:hypothetical protein
MAPPHALGFLGSICLLEALVRQRLLTTMTNSVSLKELSSLVEEREDDRRSPDDEPFGPGPDGTPG